MHTFVNREIQLPQLMEDDRLGELRSTHDLFDEVVSRTNLFAAWREFQKGKTAKKDVLEFAQDFEKHLLRLHHDLAGGTYSYDPYARFLIRDPKQRKIAKGSVRDRVLHHAICRVVVPMFDTGFIFDSYSSRKEKGTHAANKRFRKLASRLSRNNTQVVWVLKCDIRKFFESVDHEILLQLCGKKLRDEKLLALLGHILDSFHVTQGKGLPLGNLTSQLFANVYLNELDQYVKRRLGVKYYLRYTDDFVLLSRERCELEDALPNIRSFLGAELGLDLHPNKVSFRKWHHGVDFLGFVHFPHYSVVRTRTKKRIFRKLRLRKSELSRNKIEASTFHQATQSYLGILSHSKNGKVRRDIRALWTATRQTNRIP